MSKLSKLLNKDYSHKALYFAPYIGQYFGTTCSEYSYRRVCQVSGDAVYYSDTFFPGTWAHIDNCFLYLKHLDNLTNEQIKELFGLMYPKSKLESLPDMRQLCADVVYETKSYFDLWERHYTVKVHLKLIGWGVAVPYMDGTGFGKISIKELIKRGYIADPRYIKQFNKHYSQYNTEKIFKLW